MTEEERTLEEVVSEEDGKGVCSGNKVLASTLPLAFLERTGEVLTVLEVLFSLYLNV